MDYFKKSVEVHREHKGKLKVSSKLDVNNKEDLSIAYSPGVAQPCLEISKNPNEAYELTSTKNMVAVVSDGSAVLGLGNLGGLASLPVMEGKAVLFNEFAGVESFPIVLDTQNVDEIVETVKHIAPTFGGINLEDISAPRCFEIEERLKKELNIPVFHDDQHGTAIVVLAGLINALKIVDKKKEDVKVVVNGSGAGGIAIGKLLNLYGVKDIIFCDSRGIICSDREDLNEFKRSLLEFSNEDNLTGNVQEAMIGADVFVGVSVANLISKEDIETMNEDSIIFGLANPIPEIMPEDAILGGARIVATGRSDFPNQINNVLAFPGIFKGALEARCQITDEMKIAAAEKLASLVENPNEDRIVPPPFEADIAQSIATSIVEIARKQ